MLLNWKQDLTEVSFLSASGFLGWKPCPGFIKSHYHELKFKKTIDIKPDRKLVKNGEELFEQKNVPKVVLVIFPNFKKKASHRRCCKILGKGFSLSIDNGEKHLEEIEMASLMYDFVRKPMQLINFGDNNYQLRDWITFFFIRFSPLKPFENEL